MKKFIQLHTADNDFVLNVLTDKIIYAETGNYNEEITNVDIVGIDKSFEVRESVAEIMAACGRENFTQLTSYQSNGRPVMVRTSFIAGAWLDNDGDCNVAYSNCDSALLVRETPEQVMVMIEAVNADA